MRRLIMATLLSVSGTGLAVADGCYERSYSDAHMLANPMQTVKNIRARLPEARSAQAKVWVQFRPKLDPATGRPVEEDADVKEAETVYATAMICWAPAQGAPEGAWQCGVECDGGTFTAWLDAGGDLLLRTKGGFLVTGECGEPGEDEEPRWVTDINALETTYKMSEATPARCKEQN